MERDAEREAGSGALNPRGGETQGIDGDRLSPHDSRDPLETGECNVREETLTSRYEAGELSRHVPRLQPFYKWLRNDTRERLIYQGFLVISDLVHRV